MLWAVEQVAVFRLGCAPGMALEGSTRVGYCPLQSTVCAASLDVVACILE